MSLKETTASIIYEADWEINPRPQNGFNEHYMIDEDETVEAIAQAVQSLKQTTKREET